jgi:hypothetical protein
VTLPAAFGTGVIGRKRTAGKYKDKYHEKSCGYIKWQSHKWYSNLLGFKDSRVIPGRTKLSSELKANIYQSGTQELTKKKNKILISRVPD